MPVTSDVLSKISGYEKQGYSADEILKGLQESQKHPDIADKIGKYQADNYSSDDILKGIKSSKVSQAPKVDIDNTPEWAGKFPTLYGILGASKEMARFAAETAGLVGGGIAGAPIGPAGVIGGAALGYGIVKAGERATEGNTETSLPVAATRSAKDVMEGAFIEVGGRIPGAVISKVIAPVRKTLVEHVTGTLSKETETYIKATEVAGYTPTAAEITGAKSKGVALIEGMLSFLPGSAGTIQRARMANLQKLVDLRSDLLSKGANESTIENVGFRIKHEAEDLIRKTIGKRTDISNEQINSLISKYMADVNATGTGAEREFGLSSALQDFYDTSGSAPSLSSAGKTVQDVMAQVKNDRFKEAGAKLEEVSQKLGGHTVPTAKSQEIADNLIIEELKSSYPDAKVIRALKPYASLGIANKPLGGAINVTREAQEAGLQRAQTVGDFFKSPDMQKRNPELYNAWMEELGKDQKTWTGLNLDRQKLGAMIRQENALTGTDYAQTKGSTTPSGRIFTMLRSAIEDDMAVFAQKTDREAYNTFMEGRKQWFQTEQLFDNDTLRLMKKSPEDVFKAIVNPGEVANIRKLKEILGEKDFQPMKEIFTRKLIATDKNGVLDIAKTKVNINKYGETFREVFNKNEQGQVLNLVKKADEIEKGYAKSKLLKDAWVVDANGNIKLDATKKNLLKKREELSKVYTPEELTKLDETMSRLEGINLKNIARNKQEALVFLGTISSSGLAPQNIVNAIIKPNNTINIRYMKRLLGPEMSKEVETKFIENYLMDLNQFGFYAPEKAARKFNQYNKTMYSLMDENTYRETANLMRLNRNAAMLDRLATSPSQVGQTLIGFETGKEVIRSLSYALFAGAGGAYMGGGHAIAAGVISSMAVAFGPYGLAKLYLSPMGRKYLSVGYTIPAASKEGMALITKMAIIAGVNTPGSQGQDNDRPE